MRANNMVVLLALAAAACQHGPSLADYTPATQAAGISVAMNLTSGRSIAGELLTVEDSAFVVRTDEGLFRVPFRVLRALNSRPLREPDRVDRPTSDFVRRARLHSRFPGGITPEIERALLEAYRRETITLVTS